MPEKGENMKIMNWTESVKIDESKTNENVLTIRGTAVKATTSRNGVTYEIAELRKAKETLLGKTIGLDHNERMTDTIAEITEVYDTGDGLDFEAVIKNTPYHPKAVEFFRTGLVKNVSLEAVVPKFSMENGKKMARDMEFTGLSFIRTPGIKDANVSIAEAFEIATYEEPKDVNKGETPQQENLNQIKGENMEEEQLKKLTNDLNESFKTKLEEAVKPLTEKIASLETANTDLEKKLAEKAKGNVTGDGAVTTKPHSTKEGGKRVAYYESPGYIPNFVSQSDPPTGD